MILLSATGTMFQFASGVGFTRTGLGGSCQGRNLYQAGLLGSVDFCYLLDCQNGFLGGAIQPCGDPNTFVDDLLVDCPTPPLITDTTGDTQTP
jgi:hypothetical protein